MLFPTGCSQTGEKDKSVGVQRKKSPVLPQNQLPSSLNQKCNRKPILKKKPPFESCGGTGSIQSYIRINVKL